MSDIGGAIEPTQAIERDKRALLITSVEALHDETDARAQRHSPNTFVGWSEVGSFKASDHGCSRRKPPLVHERCSAQNLFIKCSGYLGERHE